MDFSWRGLASCFNCGVDYFDIDPESIIEANGRNYILCACCLKLTHVDRLGDYSPKESIKMNYRANSNDTLKDLYKLKEEGDSRARRILHDIVVMRAKMGLKPLEFQSK